MFSYVFFGLNILLFVLWLGQANGLECQNFLRGCTVCNETTLKCKNTFHQKVDAFHTFYPSLQWISVTGNNFTNKLPTNIFGMCSKRKMLNLAYLDLSYNNITKIHGKTFHCMPQLETMILSHNNWHVDNHTHVFSSLPNLKRLILRNTFFEKLNGTGHLAKLAKYIGVTGMPALEELNLAGNEFWFMPPQTHNALCALSNLNILDLSDNLLQNMTLCSDLANLRELNLANNHLSWLSKEVSQNITSMPKLKKLYLDGNLFQCDCGMIPFYHWLKNETQSHAVQNRRSLKCVTAFDTVNEGRVIMDLSLDDLVCRRGNPYNATGIVVGLLFAIIAVMFVVAMYYNRVLLKQTWKRLVGKPVTLALIPQSQGYATVKDQMRQI